MDCPRINDLTKIVENNCKPVLFSDDTSLSLILTTRISIKKPHCVHPIKWMVCSQFIIFKFKKKMIYAVYDKKTLLGWNIHWQQYVYFKHFAHQCNWTFLVYLFVRFARISNGRFIAIHHKFKLSTYVQEPLVTGRRGYLQRFKRGNG
jgi:hypothetical protein